jgi:hypothetical protein
MDDFADGSGNRRLIGSCVLSKTHVLVMNSRRIRLTKYETPESAFGFPTVVTAISLKCPAQGQIPDVQTSRSHQRFGSK